MSGDQNIGLYGFATDKYCLLGQNNKKIRKILGGPVYLANILNMDLTGLFVAGNSHGIAIAGVIAEDHRQSLERYFGNILVLDTNHTALGNLVLMNDKGIIVSPLLRKLEKKISDFFGLPASVTTIANQKVVGTLGVATNKGCLVHPKARKTEMEKIEKTLGVTADIGTVNFGSPYPGAGIIANSNGFACSERTSGPELGRITEALGFL